MRANLVEPGIISISVKFYQWMLQAYPSEFRSQFSAPMAQVFRDCCLYSLQEEGPPGVLLLWLRTLLDYVKSIIEQHSNGGIQMTHDKFFRFSGWAFIAGSLVFLIGGLASDRPDYQPFNAASLPIDRIANTIAGPAVFLGLILIALGMSGLLARFGSRSLLAKVSGGVFLLSGIVGLVGIVGASLLENEPFWYMFVYGMSGMFLGMVIFGFGAIKQNLIPGGNGLPIVAGIWVPLLALVSGVYEVSTDSGINLPTFLPLLFFGITALGIFLLGLRMQSKDLAVNI